jgi:hypothetical protein
MRGMRTVGLAGLIVGCLVLRVSGARGGEPQKLVSFERDVQPIIAANCTGCHGGNHPKAGLDLRSVVSMLQGGKSGPALSLSDPSGSLLLERIAQGEMPPGKARKLSVGEVETVRAWIRGGARTERPGTAPLSASAVRDEDRRFWSFRPLKRPPVPPGSGAAEVRTSVDSFLAARLESKGLAFSPDADACTLVRRAHLDLVGLPPSLDEIDKVLATRTSGSSLRTSTASCTIRSRSSEPASWD